MPPLPESTRLWIRDAMLKPMREYCDCGRKRLYIDKSLDSVFYLELVRQVFPDLRCVLTVRHVMDTIASGIEASPWGFNAYGYGPYVQSSPGNTVVALARYWLDHVEQALAWEKNHSEACHRVRYEDLVLQPEATVSELQRFLEVRHDLTVLRSAFDRERTRGPGDYKVEHTSSVHTDSIGHGKRVPVAMIPPPLLNAINEKLEQLGYPALDRSWNTAERAVPAQNHSIWSRQLQQLMDVRAQPTQRAGIGPFAVVAEDYLELRWIVDLENGSIRTGDGEVEAVITGTAEDLVLMLRREENLGVLLRSGRIRHLLAEEGVESGHDVLREISEVVACLHLCIQDRDAPAEAPQAVAMPSITSAVPA